MWFQNVCIFRGGGKQSKWEKTTVHINEKEKSKIKHIMTEFIELEHFFAFS